MKKTNKNEKSGKKLIIKKITIGILFLTIIFYFFIGKIFPVKIEGIKESQVFYDTRGEVIGGLVLDKKIRHKSLKYSETPNFLIKSVVQLEDKTFFSNNGIDFFAIIRAMKSNFSEGKIVEGASTISTQVIRNYFWLNEKRSFSKKILEFLYAISLNQNYSKEEIMEFYLNGIYFGYLNFGFESASNFYFGKNLKDLTKAEQIALLTIPKNSNKYNPIENKEEFYKRYEKILDLLKNENFFSEDEFILVKNEKLFFKNNEGESSVKMYLLDFLQKQKTEKKSLNTSFDINYSEKIEEIGLSTLKKLQRKNVGDFSVIIADKNTNQLKVLIGGKSYFGKEGEVNSAISKRQVGSTLKPFIYGFSFEEFGYNSETTVLDIPTKFSTKEGYAYEPKNYSLKYKGEVSIGEALSQSINIPAVKILKEIGVDNFISFLEKVGIKLEENGDFYGLSLALGSPEISLFDLVQAYSIFTNKGKFCEFIFETDKEKSCIKIIKEKNSDEIVKILSDSNVKLDGFPVNSNLNFGDKKIFVKTGTSRNFRDNYAIGFDKNFLIGVWAGNKDGSEMRGVSGATGAGEIFKKIISYNEEIFGENENFEEKNNIENNKEKEGNIKEINSDTEDFKITSPLEGSVFKIDENIKKEDQKIKISLFAKKNFDKKIILHNGKKINGDFLDLEKGKNHLEIYFYQGDLEIGKSVSGFYVE